VKAIDYLDYIERRFAWIASDSADIVHAAETALFYSLRVEMPDFNTRAEAQIDRAEVALMQALSGLRKVRANLRPAAIMEAAE
jgi:signal transduction histidine kinase